MKFKVYVSYECGFTLEVDASSDSDAMDKVLDLVEACDIPETAKMIHRDYFATSVLPVEKVNTLGG